MILVDGVTEYDPAEMRRKRLRHNAWSHMVSDLDADDLHMFAARLGLKRSWFQGRPKSSAAHYDITGPKRELAIRLGAAAVPSRELVVRNFDGLRRRGLLAMPVCGRQGRSAPSDCVRFAYHDGPCSTALADQPYPRTS